MIDDLMREELQSQAPRWVDEAIERVRREASHDASQYVECRAIKNNVYIKDS